jgi:hypothetical protein
MIQALKERPWLFVVLAFMLLIGAWTTMIVLAVNHQPEAIPLEEVPKR